MNWISVKEQLPGFGQTVIVTIDGEDPFVDISDLTFIDGTGTPHWRSPLNVHDESETNVSFWMPLPEPATIPKK